MTCCGNVRAPGGRDAVKAGASGWRCGGQKEHECAQAYRIGVCRGCGEAFWVCPYCDCHGELGYCSEEYKRLGRKRIERQAQWHYRHSPEGQAQHRDDERDRRARRPGRRGGSRRKGVPTPEGTDVQVVGDPPATKVELEASSCARDAALTFGPRFPPARTIQLGR